MQTVDPLIKQIAQFIDARSKTLEVNIKAEIVASEKRSSTKIESLDRKIDDLETNLTKKMQNIEDKVDVKINTHEKRITQLEQHSGISNGR